MAGYEKQTWTDKISDVTAERMNHIEKGIEDAGKTGGVETGSVIGWTGAEVPEGYEEVDSSLIPSGVEVGTIVHIEDDAPIPEGYVEVTDPNEIIDISDTGITLLDGFSKGTGFCLYKQGKRIFGDLIIEKSENWSATHTDVQVGTMTYRPKREGIFTNSQMADAFWAIGVNGYFAIESTSKVKVKTSDVSKKVIKVHIEYVTY